MLNETDLILLGYDVETGFLGRLRSGEADDVAFERLLSTLRSVRTPADNACLPRRFVSAVWLIPTLIEWQIPHMARSGRSSEQLTRWASEVRNEVERILGFP